MLVVVKKHLIDFRVEGNIPCELIDSLKHEYGDAMRIEDDGELMCAEDMDWYKNLQAEDTPGKNLRFYRKMQKLTQAQLAEKIGVAKQFISDMERDYKPISRQMAKRLAGIFSVDAGRFI